MLRGRFENGIRMKILVINLDRSADRLERMRQIFAGAGLDFERLAAVDGKLLPPEEQSVFSGQRNGQPVTLTPGEIGCYLSHVKAWKTLLDGTGDHVLVVEDDVHFSPKAGSILKETGWIPPDADIVKLETARTHVRLANETAATIGDISVRKLESQHLGTAAYIVSRAGAKKLLGLTESRKDRPIDKLMFGNDAALTIYQLDPAPVIQDQVLRGNFFRADVKSLITQERKGRQKRRLNLGQKAIREILRPFRQISEGLKVASQLFWHAITGKPRRKIPFG